MPSPFALRIRVGDDAIDMLNHVSNIAHLKWIQDAALAHSAAVGFGIEAYEKLGAVFVVRQHQIDYLRPAFLGDLLEVRTWIDSAFAAKCKRATEIVRVTDDVVVGRAMTTWGFVELATGRPIRIPDSVRVAFSQPTMGELQALRKSEYPAAPDS